MMFLGLRKLGKHLLRTQNVSEQNRKHFLCPQQMLRARANRETFVSATMCRLPGPLQCIEKTTKSLAPLKLSIFKDQ